MSALASFAAHGFFDFDMQIPPNALLAAACAGILANSGVAPWGQSGKRRMMRWLTGAVSCVGGIFLSVLLFQYAEPEWAALQAENALIRADYPAAIRAAEQGVAVAPQHARLRRLLGEALIRQAPAEKNPRESYVLSTFHLRRATEGDPSERWNQLMLGISLGSLRLMQSAELAHLEAIRLDPGNPSVHEYYGLFLEGAGRRAAAIRAYENALGVPGTQFAAERLRALRASAK
jgi:tetratricopeptide (TPR) repeat protein